MNRFTWHSYDLRSALPDGWQLSVLDLVDRELATHVITPGSGTSREDAEAFELPTHIVDSAAVARELPWIPELYTGLLRDLAQLLSDEPVSTAANIHRGARIQVQKGDTERYECHVDTCPITGLLYVTDHPVGAGGELVVANRGDVLGRDAVDHDASRIHPVAGHLILFDGRRRTHYVAPLRKPGDLRVVIPMVFFTASCSEDMRPPELDHYLGLE
jgi:hypothetical protein